MLSGKTEEEMSKWVDGDWDNKIFPNVTATVPEYIQNPKNDWERGVNAYRDCVKRHMVHHCAVAENGCKETPLSKCKSGFDSKELRPETTFDATGFPIYKRNRDEDLKIVAHNPLILMDWDGHCNVEWAAGPKSVLYLYSYLYKGTLIVNSPCTTFMKKLYTNPFV